MKILRYLLFIVSVMFFTNLNGQSVYITKTGKKYHNSNCQYLKYSKKEVALEDAIFRAYEACLVCKPSSKVDNITKDNITSKKTPSKSQRERKAVASQCTGRTKKGSRCKRRTKNSSGRCFQH